MEHKTQKARQLAAIGVFAINLLLVVIITFVFWALVNYAGNPLDYLSTSWMFWNIPITLFTYSLMLFNWGGQERLIYHITERYWNQTEVLVSKQTDTLKEAISEEGDRSVRRMKYAFGPIKDKQSQYDTNTKEQLERIEQFQMTAAGIEPRIPDDVKRQVWIRDKGRCVRCGSNENVHIDRAIPVRDGGDDSIGNVQLLCLKCNPLKGHGLEKHGDIRLMKAVMKLDTYGFTINAYGEPKLVQTVHPIWGGMERPFMYKEKIAIALLVSYPDQLDVAMIRKLTKLSPPQIHSAIFHNKEKFEKSENTIVKLSSDGLRWIITTIEDIDGYKDITSGVSTTFRDHES